jgi:hypothetical protein
MSGMVGLSIHGPFWLAAAWASSQALASISCGSAFMK